MKIKDTVKRMGLCLNTKKTKLMTTGNPTTLITESNHTVVLTSFKSVYVNNRTNNQEIYCKPALVRVAMKRYSDAKMCICLQRLGLSRHWFSMSHSMEAEVQL